MTQTPETTIRLRFKHGLGDAIQFQIVLHHLLYYYPDCRITLETTQGREGLFEHLVDEISPLVYPFNQWAASISKSIGYGEYTHEFAYDWPPTKATECLIRDFHLEPVPELFFYSACIGPEAQQKVDEWLAKLPRPIVAFHYEGNSRPQNKNIDLPTAREIAEGLVAKGCSVVLLDYSLNKVVNGSTIVQPKDLPKDAETLAALIDGVDGFIGIDSGPGHLAAATNTPGYIVWTGHHPAYFFDDPAPTLTHLLCPGAVLANDDGAVKAYFEETFNHQYLGLKDLATTVIEGIVEKMKQPKIQKRFNDWQEYWEKYQGATIDSV